MSSWGRGFASDLVALAPPIVILHILAFFYSGITSIPYVATVLPTDRMVTPFSEALGFTISIIIFLLLVLSVGCLIRTMASHLLESSPGAAMNKIPLARIVYNAFKLTVEAALVGTGDLQKPIRLETRPGTRMAMFKTGKTTKDGKVIVFMPTAPNTTTGFVMEVDPGDIEEAGEKIEEALMRVLSAGFAGQDHMDEFNIEVTEEFGDGRVPSNE